MLTSVLILFALGFVAAVVLAIASRVFYVEEDPRVEAVLDVLPGANCGGCGYPGCEGYAVAVVLEPGVGANLCVAGDAKTTANVGELTGKAVSEADPLISVRRCEKIEGQVEIRFEYQGMASCASAAELGSGLGFDACKYSCLGLGDCLKVCPFDAIILEENVAKIDPDRCIGCGKCIPACPRNALELVPKSARVMVFCSTKDKSKAVTSVCSVGCIACTLCVKKCPAKAVEFTDNIVKINHQICKEYGDSCNEACVAACKRKIFKSLLTPAKIAKLEAEKEMKEEMQESIQESPQETVQEPVLAETQAKEKSE